MNNETEQPVTQVVKALEQTMTTGSRCDQCTYCNREDHVGQPTSAQSLKQRWKSDLGKGRKSLKRFARELVASGDQMARDWFDHKKGSLNETRSEKNKARATLESQASKASRRKNQKGGSASAK